MLAIQLVVTLESWPSMVPILIKSYFLSGTLSLPRRERVKSWPDNWQTLSRTMELIKHEDNLCKVLDYSISIHYGM